MPSSAASAAICFSRRSELEAALLDGERKVLADFVFVEHLTDPHADLVAPGERAVVDAGPDLLQFLLGRLQQRLAFVRAQLRQIDIAAGHQPLARELRMRELKEIALIEQAELQRTALHQGADLRALQRRDPGRARRACASSPIALCEIMPRSPTSTRRSRPNCSRSCVTCGIRVLASAVLPSYTEIATGQPARVVSSP